MLDVSLPTSHSGMVATINMLFNKHPAGENDPDQTVCTEILAPQIRLIASEHKELIDALTDIASPDVTEYKMRDAMADILVTAYGLPYLLTGNVNTYEEVFSDVMKIKTLGMVNSIDLASLIASTDLNRANKDDSEDYFALRMQTGFNEAYRESLLIWIDTNISPIVNRLVRIANRIESGNTDVGFDFTIDLTKSLITKMYILQARVGIPSSSDLHAVCTALTTRLCDDNNLPATVKKYEDMGMTVRVESSCIDGLYAVIVDEAIVIDGEDYPRNKFLKSVDKKDPVFQTVTGGENGE